jgi:hypothetical protein
MSTLSTGTCFVKAVREGNLVSNSLATGTLVDNDLIRGGDAGVETVLLTNGAEMARLTENGDTITIFLTGGDGDRTILQNVPDTGPLFKLQLDADFIL